MQRILILGANGQIAKLVSARLLAETDDDLTLYLRKAARLQMPVSKRVTIIEGDVNDYPALLAAMKNQDVIYANLGGEFEPMVANIVKAMSFHQIQRLIYVTGLGLYHEVPGAFGQWVEATIGTPIMADTRRAAKIIEDSKLNYTIIRAAYMNNDPNIDYELTPKGTPFKGTIVSRASIADFIVKALAHPQQYAFSSFGINQPGTDGDRPY